MVPDGSTQLETTRQARQAINVKMINSFYLRALVLFFLLPISIPSIYARSGVHVALSEQEKAFILDHPVIRISNETDWPPFDFTIGDQPFGISIDVVNLAADRLGLTVQYINGYRWNEMVEMFKRRQIDILQSAYEDEDRKEYGLFSTAYYKDKTVFVVPEEAPDISDIRQLAGKIIAMPKGWAYEKYLISNYPEINLLTVKNMDQAFRSVKNGKADAVIELSAVARYLIEKNFMDGLKISGWFMQYDNNEKRSLHLLVRNDWPILHQMFEKALESITPGDIHAIEEKWLGWTEPDQAADLELSPEEQQFLEHHPVIRVANETDWPPIDFVKNDKPAGFAIDYLKLLGRNLGIRLEFVNGYPWPDLLEMGREKQVDIFPGLWKSPDRESYLRFTQPYIELIKVLAVRKGSPPVSSMADMKNLSITLPKGYLLSEELIRTYPDFRWILVDNPTQGLKQVSLGQADGFIGSQGVINHIIKKQFIDNIQMVFEVKTDTPLPLHMAVRGDWPVLAAILNKAMDAVPQEQFNRLVDKWIGSNALPGMLNSLTRNEVRYLENKERISLCVQRNMIPFESMDTANAYNGIIADFFTVMGEKTGIPFTVTSAGTEAECLDCLLRRRCDMVTVAPDSYRRQDSVQLTLPYAEYPLVIATDSKALYINSISDLPEKRIGIDKNSAFLDDIRSRYPAVTFVPVENTREGLLAVQGGHLFGYVDTAPKIGFYIQDEKMVDLKISGELPLQVFFQAAVHRDAPLLNQIFEKAVDSLTPSEKKQIFQSWITLKYEQQFDYSLLWKIGLFMGILITFFMYRHISLTRYNVRLSELNSELTAANKKLEQISYIDGLTGVANRRKFDSVLPNEWRRCQRAQHFLTLILLDIDFFKRFNDRYGHLEGDDCLKRVAETIQHIPSRPADFVARYGGEEFAIILPETDLTGAEQIAKKICDDVRHMKIPHQDSDVSEYVTVSLGVACVVPGKEITLKQFVDMADQLLYSAKENGRNQYNLLIL